MRILFFNPVSQPRRFVPLEAIKGSPFFRRPNYQAMQVSYLSQGNEFYYYDEQVEAPPDIEPDLLVVNVPLNLARYVETIIEERWPGKTKRILCGIFPTLYPEQAKKLADAVVVGDVASVWLKILKDYETNSLFRIYESAEHKQFSVDRKIEAKYGFTPVLSQLRTSFGCQCRPEQKDYCYERVLHKDYQECPVDDVVKEVANLRRKIILVLDDDFLFNMRRGLRILNRCRASKKMWIFQTTSSVFNHPEVFSILREAGVRIIYLKEDWLGNNLVKEIANRSFIKEKAEQVNIIHNNRIAIAAKIRLGFEGESFHFYRRLAKFLIDIKVDLIEVSAQTPLPKTETYKIKKKNKEIVDDITLYDQWLPVVQLPGIKPQDLYSWTEWLRDRFYSWDSIIRRNFFVAPKFGLYNTIFFYLIPNLSYRENFLEKIGYPP